MRSIIMLVGGLVNVAHLDSTQLANYNILVAKPHYTDYIATCTTISFVTYLVTARRVQGVTTYLVQEAF